MDNNPPILKKKLTSQQELNQIFLENPLFWGFYHLPNHFRNKSPTFHLKIVLEALKHRFFAVAAPRESAKSTILNFLMSLHGICHKKFRFIVILQSTEEKAQGSLYNIKYELKHNPSLKHLKIDITRDTKDDSIFTHPDGFQTRVLCKGREQMGSVRGEKFTAYRPDLIIIDDIEDDKMVQNPDLRAEIQMHIDKAIIPAGQRGVCRYIVVGTILHFDSQMAKFVSLKYYSDWRKLKYVALWESKNEDPDSSLWEENWTVEELYKMRDDNPVVFATEYQNDPTEGVLRNFEIADFRQWRQVGNEAVLLDDQFQVMARYNFRDCVAAIACDLAWEEKKTSDDSVIMPGFLTPNSEILIFETICKKGMKPDELEEILFSMEERLTSMTGGSVAIGFEKANLEKVMKWLLKEAMKRRNHFLQFRELAWDKDKITRIVTRLQARYKQHMIFHLKGMGKLETQLVQVPSGAHDDLPDAAQGLVQLLKYPKKAKKSEDVDDHFKWLQNQVIANQKSRKYIFGEKPKSYGIPAKESWF